MTDASVGVHDIQFVTLDEAFEATRLAPIFGTGRFRLPDRWRCGPW
jgi:hypothetical protein